MLQTLIRVIEDIVLTSLARVLSPARARVAWVTDQNTLQITSLRATSSIQLYLRTIATLNGRVITDHGYRRT